MSRGNAVRSAGRVALVASAAVVFVLAVSGWGGVAGAQPIGRESAVPTGSGPVSTVAPETSESFYTSKNVVVFSAIGPGGNRVHISAMVMDSSFLPAQVSAATGGLSTLPSGELYFHIWLLPQGDDPAVNVPIYFPAGDASLVTNDGTVKNVSSGNEYDDGALLYFPVSDSITFATLETRATTVTAYKGNEVAGSYRIQPLTIHFMTSMPVPVPVPGPTGQSGVPGFGSPLHVVTASDTSSDLGLGIGALVVLAAGAAGLVSFRRRRAFYRADREGRVVLSGPPTLLAGATLAGGVAPPPGRRAIVVKLLGALEIEGTRRPVTAGPLLEIIVFLALNPGRNFTSVQLRESIWGLGRQSITSASFRTYMVALRKAFGTGVVVTNRQRYEMTGSVTSDWDQFRAALGTDDELTGREQAVALVRGPVLHGSFDGRKNSPFSWAVGDANAIEDQVTSVAVELALSCLELKSPGRAAIAVSQGLLCWETNLRLRKIDLRVGSALGGPKEVGRRLAAGRAAVATFPKDVAELEDEARILGWAVPLPG